MRNNVLRYLCLFIVVAAIAGFIFSTQKDRRITCKNCNVIFISLDQVRAKSLPCLGYTKNTMPNLCRFAAKSQLFTRSYAPASRTMDSHFSMMTSLYPSTHTMNLPYASVLPNDIPTLAQRLKNEGYQTYFFGPTTDPHLPLTGGLERGFDAVYEADNPRLWTETFDAIATRSSQSNTPSFFFMHTYLAHEPYVPEDEHVRLFYDGPERKRTAYEDLCKFTYLKLQSLHPEAVFGVSGDKHTYCERLDSYHTASQSYQEFNDIYAIFNDEYWRQFDDLPQDERGEYTHALYAATLFELDIQLGKFFEDLEKKGMMENTIIVIVGDQGDEFFEHGSYSHGSSLYNEVLHVPFIVYVPGYSPSRSNKLVSLVDIMPTILGAIGKKSPKKISGIDVFSARSHLMVIAEHVNDGALSLRTDRHSLIVREADGETEVELYDTDADFDERTNIAAENKIIVTRLLGLYKKLRSGFPTYPRISYPLPTWINEQDRQELIESGYF
jgi:arylsulfatase A-like enzyme